VLTDGRPSGGKNLLGCGGNDVVMKAWSVAYRILKFCEELGGWLIVPQVYHRFPEYSRASLKERLYELAKHGYLKRTRRGGLQTNEERAGGSRS